MIYKAIKLPGEAVRVNGVLVWPCAVIDTDPNNIKEGDIITDGKKFYPVTVLLDAYIGLYKTICTIGVKLEGVEMAVEKNALWKLAHNATAERINKLGFKNVNESEYQQGFWDGYNSREGYTREDMDRIRNKIVDLLPTGDVSAWDMIKAVEDYTKWFDDYINSLSLPREISEVELNGLEIIKMKYK